MASRTGFRRQVCPRPVEEGVTRIEQQHPMFTTMVDQKWDSLTSVVRDTAEKQYAKGTPKTQLDGDADIAEQLLET